MARNHTAMTGPKTRPTLPVPRDCTMNSTQMMAQEIGTMKGCRVGAATSTPSTADRTETAGVITPSPKNRQAPMMPMKVSTTRGLSRRRSLGQRHQGQDAAFALVVGAHHEEHVFDGDDDDQRPEDQREDAEDFELGDAEWR